MSQLDEVPLELLQAIVSSFDVETDRTTLLNLCNVSRKLCSAAQPILYTEFALPLQSQTPSPPARPVVWTPLNSLILFARTVVARPDLAARIRGMEVCTYHRQVNEQPQKPDDLSPQTLDILNGAVRETHDGWNHDWNSQDVSVRFDAFLGFVVSRAPNVERFSADLAAVGLDQVKRLARHRIGLHLSQPPYLARLKELTLSGSPILGITLNEVVSLLSLPSLSIFTAWGLVGDNSKAFRGRVQKILVPGSLNLVKIHLFEARMSVECLSTLVGACKQLQHFRYHTLMLHEEEEWMVGVAHLNATQIFSALSTQRETLESVTFGDIASSPRPLSPFNEWTRLKHLQLPQEALGERPDPPESLETLTINVCTAKTADTIAALAGQKGQTLRTLRTITVQTSGIEYHWRFTPLGRPRLASDQNRRDVEEGCQRVRHMLDAAGIELVMDLR